MARPAADLPTFYYRDHFVEMLDFVATQYAHVLGAAHCALIDDFAALPHGAQCLYVRLVNRKGRVFAWDRLRYPELGALASLASTLAGAGWIRPPRAAEVREALAALTRERIAAAVAAEGVAAGRSLRKDALIELACSRIAPQALAARLAAGNVIVQRRTAALRFVLYLYFGRVQDNLSRFALRDLGIARTQSFRDVYEPRFADRDEAREHFYYARRLHEVGADIAPPPQAFLADLASWPEPNHSGSARLRDELAYALGRALERDGEPEAALRVYRRGESADCSERVIRLLLQKDRDAARAWIERCLDAPRSDAEWLVARDIQRLKFEKRRRSAPTRWLQAAETIDLDEAHLGAPETAALAHYRERGADAHRTENALWRTLFGLLFWDTLFASETATLHSPFDFLPATLRDGDFRQRHADAVARALAVCADRPALATRLRKMVEAHQGTANGVFRWRRRTLAALDALIEHAPPAALRAIVEQFCDDYCASRHGWPDLMTVDGDGVRFVEIKAEGDQLRRNQVLRLEQLRAAGFRADVVRVRWTLDPDQTYVVVDVETTGGRGATHRVTEIGAVRVRDGAEVATFETLLNPGRRIPAPIARLTGITDAMVADAPPFEAVADAFETFVGDAIFVAHNVDFDYGFIAREYARLGRRFRRTKLCTCASMRKFYPGRRSYSLAALTREFGIALPEHHRALCDARAAAGLLNLVNARRRERH